MYSTNKNFCDVTKVLKVISNILEKEARFRSHWSSAENFERWLKEDGIIPACKISHKYKFPAGISEEDYEKQITNNMYYFIFNPMRISDTKRYVEHMYKNIPDASAKEKQEILDFFNDVTGELNDAEKQKIISHFTDAKNVANARSRIENMVHEIKRLNPILADIPVTSLEDADDLLVGVTSRFHPEDIKYFITEKKKAGGLDRVRQDQELFYTVLNYSPNVFMAPSRIKQIVDGIILQKQGNWIAQEI
jgi:uncharacterized short protein YbdD (DUF466 family)